MSRMRPTRLDGAWVDSALASTDTVVNPFAIGRSVVAHVTVGTSVPLAVEYSFGEPSGIREYPIQSPAVDALASTPETAPAPRRHNRNVGPGVPAVWSVWSVPARLRRAAVADIIPFTGSLSREFQYSWGQT